MQAVQMSTDARSLVVAACFTHVFNCCIRADKSSVSPMLAVPSRYLPLGIVSDFVTVDGKCCSARACASIGSGS